MGKGRPGGNPVLKEHRYNTKRPESVGPKLSIRIEPSVWEALQEQDSWQEEVRKAIAQVVNNKGRLSEELKQYYGVD